MSYDSALAEKRFGCGLSPIAPRPASAAEVLGRLTGPDHAAEAWPIEPYASFELRLAEYVRLNRVISRNRNTPLAKGARRDRAELRKETSRAAKVWMGHALLRRATTEDGFRERLAFFWADHFTAQGKSGIFRYAVGAYAEEAIRPHLTGRFADLLRAAATAPLLIWSLDQARSLGPNSARAKKANRGGLNENLAREMLELHTLGVGAEYTQQDVIELAELLTGVTYTPGEGFRFRPGRAEPGPETVLGVSYGGNGKARLADVEAALEDLARHPATGEHLSRKLAVHFLGDDPSPDLVAAMTKAYRDSDGVLLEVYRAMLDHPAAWTGQGNVKQPVDFVGSSLRALGVGDLPLRRTKLMHLMFSKPLALMGQPWERPDGPDGWPEADDDWITPQRLAGRLQWALNVPPVLADPLPDPRDFVEMALGGDVPEPLRFAAKAAESRAEGIAIILGSPAFQRM